ncbi:CTP synthase [Mycoplasmoides fastidiosum]|uniref:CTP synthase n=1 Tax=Mycoplasmoides fastidiosum TaxID=92758 RepID=A0ABU0M075_9BACT|nr:CTP synthase [Mycoplasmoides fastidiosum]MDQ0514351.1 CTP synthase [Mycoplasmoides fastidiosum]UUD38048.1 CTP synthase [Mycoplasmoides fastidiosum]
MNKTKIIVITGGVFSSLGKGIAAASLGRILKEKGFKVGALKLDPYLNLDPGTMSPYQHGEVFVTDDGAETDLDLGHYERFLDYKISKLSSLSAGKIYDLVLKKERNGDYKGKTVQIVPHVTDEIKNHITQLLTVQADLDFLMIEVGGTIGDIESLPFVEALRQFKNSYGRTNMMFIHMAPLVMIDTTQELKTKPTQHSIKSLREHGIIPDLLILRIKQPLDEQLKEKISITCDIEGDSIFTCEDVSNIYLIPELLYRQNIDQKILQFFHLNQPQTDDHLTKWMGFTQKITAPKKYVCHLGLVGKYTELPDSYLSIIESFKLASYELDTELQIELFNAEQFEDKSLLPEKLGHCDAVCVPYGFGDRGVEGKINTIEYCRINDLPFLGICLGMQLACIEFARNQLHYADATSTEFDPQTTTPIFKLQKDKDAEINLGGTLRLGSEPIHLKRSSLTYQIYNNPVISERHRHRYEFNNDFVTEFEQAGFVFAGQSVHGMQEIIEIPQNKFFVACQFHPEFNSKPLKVGPLFTALIKAARKEK